MSANFCSVWASGLLSCANWACMICIWRQNTSMKSVYYRDHEIPDLVHTGPPNVVRELYICKNKLQIILKTHGFFGWDLVKFVCLTCSCSAVKDVRALLAGFGWLSCSVGTAPSNVIPLPEKHTKKKKKTADKMCWETILIKQDSLRRCTWTKELGHVS